MTKPTHDRGYLIPAFDTAQIDYVSCARTLAKSLKFWHPDTKICLLTDHDVLDPIFDIVRVIDSQGSGTQHQKDFSRDAKCFDLSPFHETIKLEADMIISGPIDHWWTALRNRDVVLSVGCWDHQHRESQCRYYRKVFDNNQLLDVYNALTYWRYSRTAKEFFSLVGYLFSHWHDAKGAIKNVQDEEPNTDLIYAVAADIMGRDLVHIPDLDFFRIAHLKHKIIGLPTAPWNHWMTWEIDHGVLRIDGHAQAPVVHYHEKTFCRELEPIYDQLLASGV